MLDFRKFDLNSEHATLQSLSKDQLAEVLLLVIIEREQLISLGLSECFEESISSTNLEDLFLKKVDRIQRVSSVLIDRSE